MKITIETIVAASVEDVWQAWTTPEDIKKWNAASADWHCPEARIDLRPGGQFSYRMEAKDGSMAFDFNGTFERITPEKLIQFSMGDSRSVVVEFIAGNGEVKVTETFEAESVNAAEQQRQGWQAILDNFAQHVEGKPSKS